MVVPTIHDLEIHTIIKYNETVCDSLVTDYKDENELIQENVAQFSVYKTLINSIFPIFFAFYLGAWADLFGRKLLLKIAETFPCI